MTTNELPADPFGITPDIARRLFDEARRFFIDDATIAPDSEIRLIARQVYAREPFFRGERYSHLHSVCVRIFFVIACDAMGVS